MFNQSLSQAYFASSRFLSSAILVLAAALSTSAFLPGCSPTSPSLVPAAVTDFEILVATPHGALLHWTAPAVVAGAEPIGYDIRYATSPMNNTQDWNNATIVENVPTPADPGTPQQMEITGLQPRTEYYISMRVIGRLHIMSRFSAQHEVLTGDSTILDQYTLQDVDGNSHSSSEWLGHRLIVLNFWAVWCHYCVQEMPDLSQLYSLYRDSGVVLIGLDCGDDTTTLQNFLTTNNITWPNLVASSDIYGAYGISGIPTTVFLDSNGVELGVRVGKGSFDTYRIAVSHFLSRNVSAANSTGQIAAEGY